MLMDVLFPLTIQNVRSAHFWIMRTVRCIIINEKENWGTIKRAHKRERQDYSGVSMISLKLTLRKSRLTTKSLTLQQDQSKMKQERR